MIKQYKIFLLAAISLLAFSIYAQFIGSSWGDKVLTIFNAKMLFEGRELYKDIFTVQPPLIDYIYLLPVYLAAHLPIIPADKCLVLLTIFSILLSIYTSLQIIKFNPEFNNKKKQIEFCLLLAFVLIFFNQQFHFADREHLFFCLALPYFMRWLPSVSQSNIPIKIRVIIGVMAAIGFCIKPYFFIMFIFIQLSYFLLQRNLRILLSVENFIIYLFTSLYIASIWIFTPEYINIVLPMALETYSAASNKIMGIIFAAIDVLILAITLSEFRLRYNSPYRRDIFYLLSICPAFLLYALVNNGWGYTWNLLTLNIFILTGFVLWEFQYLNKTTPKKQFLFGIRTCLFNFSVYTAFMAMFLSTGTFWVSCKYTLQCPEGKEFLQNLTKLNDNKPVKSFGAISTEFVLWEELNQSEGMKWETRFNQLWMIPKFLISDAKFAEQHKWILEYVANAFAEDIEKRKPEIIFVDEEGHFYEIHKEIDFIAYFSIFPNFKKALDNYKYIAKINLCTKCSSYSLYKRKQ